MSVATTQAPITVALIGNPNTGKSTLFSALAGVRQRIGNYPGVTVERKIGVTRLEGRSFELVDLPGTYSLAPRSPDEMVAVDVLLGRQAQVKPPDVVMCIVDASNLQRNLYLVSQALEFGLPTIVVLNMIDVAEKKGMRIDVGLLERQLGVPVVKTHASRGVGIDQLKETLSRFESNTHRDAVSPLPEEFSAEVGRLQEATQQVRHEPLPRYLAERLLLDTGGYVEQSLFKGRENGEAHILAEVSAARSRLDAAGFPVPAIEAMARYQWVGDVLEGVIDHRELAAPERSDRIDRVLTHKVWGTLIFALVMLTMFQSVFAWAEPLMDGIETVMNWLGDGLAALLPSGAVESLMVDGVVAGVGGVLVFLPQILILFLFIGVLEDCGYMARAAYLMDKLMSKIGLSGKSFIPLLSSFACAVPGIMAARVIENRRDRLVTVLIAPLMSCSARLPVYVLLVKAFVPERSFLGGWFGLQGLTMAGMYLVGIVTAIVVAFVLKKTILPGEAPPFVMELPSYKTPSARVVFFRMADRGWSFVRRAGTLILAVSVLVWAATYYPRNPEVDAPYTQRIAELEARKGAIGEDSKEDAAELARIECEIQEVKNRRAGAHTRQSLLGRAGQAFEPVVRPLGWDWRIGCAVIASFPAREVVISTLSVIYNLGQDEDEASEPLRETLKKATWDGTDRPVYNLPVALSLMVFFALCAQCAATLAVMKRETNSWRWPAFTFVYMTTLAYLGALVTYQVGMLFV